jgi:phenylacetate-CoA ligase
LITGNNSVLLPPRQRPPFINLIKKRLATELGIGVEIKLVGEKTLARSEGKAKRIIDQRQL